MESNSNGVKDELVSIINPRCIDLAKKCLDHVSSKKISVEDEEIKFYINDEALLRFLTARDFDDVKAFNMWAQWAEWRIQYRPEKIMPKDIKNELMSGKAFLHGYDKEGRPCVVVKTYLHFPEKTDIEEFMKFFIYLIDSACRLADT
jgi:hypothetical protein